MSKLKESETQCRIYHGTPCSLPNASLHIAWTIIVDCFLIPCFDGWNLHTMLIALLSILLFHAIYHHLILIHFTALVQNDFLSSFNSFIRLVLSFSLLSSIDDLLTAVSADTATLLADVDASLTVRLDSFISLKISYSILHVSSTSCHTFFAISFFLSMCCACNICCFRRLEQCLILI